MNKHKRKIIFISLIGFVLLLALVIIFYPKGNTEKLPDDFSRVNTSVENITVNIGESKIITVPEGFALAENQSLPEFLIVQNSSIEITPKKQDKGSFFLNYINKNNSAIAYNILIENKTVDWESLSKELEQYLQPVKEKYGVYVYDLSRNESLGINEDVQFPPSSTAKLPVAILVMRDIQNGKYTLEDTYPVQTKYKHSTVDSIGKYPEGTKLTIETYLEAMMIESNNSAWYHLVQMLGSPWGDTGVNQRTINELGVNPYFIDPYVGTAKNLAQQLADVYNLKTLNEENSQYLINMMKRALKFNREGIGLGLPTGVEFANKLGYHWTPDLVNFVDGAIVFGHNRDYVVGILDKDIDWSVGKKNLQELSKIIYKYLDN
jgi:beta-lactamase class A